MEYILNLLLILFFIALNAFFVAAEFALVSVRRTRIDELVRKGNRFAKLVQRSVSDLDTYISSTQLGITISSLALGWVGEPALARIFTPLFSLLGNFGGSVASHTLSAIIAFLLITFFTIVLGELVPKTIALQKAEMMSYIVIIPLIGFTNLFRPFIRLLNAVSNFIIRPFGFYPMSGEGTLHTEDEIRLILNQSGEMGAIEKEEVEMVENVFRLGDIPVKQIMIPRTSVVAFNINLPLKEIIKKVSKKVHSRFPVYDKSIENIVGFIHVKDLYGLVIENENLDKKLVQTKIIRDIVIVPEAKKVDEVLLDMRRRWIHIAVVSDEFGGTAGIVTLEDIMESVVGEIEDEFEKHTIPIQRQPDGSYLVDGLVSVEKVQKRFNLPLKGLGYRTIGGLIFGFLGKQPEAGDTIQIGPVSLEVVRLVRKRVKTVRLKKEIKINKTRNG